ncbi:MAG TPA: DHH family phosphoesterase [Isosphaeraceae bacterium]|jgi:nanoRNase/pAp phosphatase (c-di-AMP/oligoRNAs hydrolase)|nr:DHH family phosphoesterase [Isosphaeraceae bacterium]
MMAESDEDPVLVRQRRSERFLATLDPFGSVVLVSHVNPDPDALASMLGLEALLAERQRGKPVTITVDGMIARAENQAMVDLLQIPLKPINQTPIDSSTAVVMVDSQPHTGRRASEAAMPLAVLDHHETPGVLDGVQFRDIRPHFGATSTIVTGYLLEQDLAVSPRLATALLYGIESETSGYPRESGPQDDGAMVWLFPRADKDLLAQIQNPKLPQSYFATFQRALASARLYHDVVVSWCGVVPQPDIIAELADFFVRFDQVNWAVCIGLFENLLKVSVRVSNLGGHCGEVLRSIVDGLGSAGGHDKRAGGAILVTDRSPEAIDAMIATIRHRLLEKLQIDERDGRPLVDCESAGQIP